MYCLIFICGGLLIMMGEHTRSESLSYYFKPDRCRPPTVEFQSAQQRRRT